MSKKIKAKNKHVNQNIRGEIRGAWAIRGDKRSELGQGVFRYREKYDFKKKPHKANAYQERKRKRAQRKRKPFEGLGSLFS